MALLLVINVKLFLNKYWLNCFNANIIDAPSLSFCEWFISFLFNILLAYQSICQFRLGIYVIILPQVHILKHRNPLSTEGRGHTCLEQEIPTNAVLVPAANYHSFFHSQIAFFSISLYVSRCLPYLEWSLSNS